MFKNLILLLFIAFSFVQTCSENKKEICDSSCKSCSRLCDPDACTSCYPRHFKLSLEFEDSEFQCSNNCTQNYSLPIHGQRYRYCNISKPIKIDESKNYENKVVEVLRAKVVTESELESSAIMFIIFGVVVGVGIFVIIILTILIRYKRSKMPRHNSATEELLRKESEAEVEGRGSKTNEKKFERNYLNIAGVSFEHAKNFVSKKCL